MAFPLFSRCLSIAFAPPLRTLLLLFGLPINVHVIVIVVVIAFLLFSFGFGWLPTTSCCFCCCRCCCSPLSAFVRPRSTLPGINFCHFEQPSVSEQCNLNWQLLRAAAVRLSFPSPRFRLASRGGSPLLLVHCCVHLIKLHQIVWVVRFHSTNTKKRRSKRQLQQQQQREQRADYRIKCVENYKICWA